MLASTSLSLGSTLRQASSSSGPAAVVASFTTTSLQTPSQPHPAGSRLCDRRLLSSIYSADYSIPTNRALKGAKRGLSTCPRHARNSLDRPSRALPASQMRCICSTHVQKGDFELPPPPTASTTRQKRGLHTTTNNPSTAAALKPSALVKQAGAAASSIIGDSYQPPSAPDAKATQPGSEQGVFKLDQINRLMQHPLLFDPLRIPRNPLVLCHGLYGFDVRGPAFFRLHYWGDLLKILRGKIGAEVFVTAVPGTGAVKDRANKLHDALTATEGLAGRDLNFIGHSMGGLDARYLISKIKPDKYHPRSLTTLSTPHRGSEFMAWCRANIGIGTAVERAMAEEAARAAKMDDTPIPYTLKQPLLSRKQIEEAKAKAQSEGGSNAAESSKSENDRAAALGLPFSVTAAVSGWLLDLLDSPAYANLTPSFLKDVFNPNVPDDPNVRYYSIAARTDKINIWHPLWLPKMVLDGAATARAERGQIPEPYLRGNDGLVAVESARWGEFLGVIENCDHWDLRGSSGLVNASATAKAVAESEGRDFDTSTNSAGDKGWSWQDVYALVGSKQSKGKGAAVEVTSSASPSKGGSSSSQDDSTLSSLASWIAKRIPGIGPSASSSSSALAQGSITSFPPPTMAVATSALPSARRIYGVQGTSKSKGDKFDLERMVLGVCKKLYDEGL